MSLVLILVIYLCAEISDTSKTWDSKTFGVLIRRNMDRDHGVGSCFVSLVCHYADCCYWYSYFLIWQCALRGSVTVWPEIAWSWTKTRHRSSGWASVSNSKVTLQTLRLLNATVPFSTVINDLGVLDNQLTMADHIAVLSRSCFFHLRWLRSINQSLMLETTHSCTLQFSS